MEHRHNRQHHVATGDVHGIGNQSGVSVEHGGAMAVEHAFGVARSARGVTERAGRLLVQLGPCKFSTLGRHDLLVAKHIGSIGLWHVLTGGHNDPALDTRALASDPLDQGPEVGVKEDVAIFGVIDDVDDLFWEKPRVDGVTDEARAGRAVVGLHMTVVIPSQRGDAVTRL